MTCFAQHLLSLIMLIYVKTECRFDNEHHCDDMAGYDIPYMRYHNTEKQNGSIGAEGIRLKFSAT